MIKKAAIKNKEYALKEMKNVNKMVHMINESIKQITINPTFKFIMLPIKLPITSEIKTESKMNNF